MSEKKILVIAGNQGKQVTTLAESVKACLLEVVERPSHDKTELLIVNSVEEGEKIICTNHVNTIIFPTSAWLEDARKLKMRLLEQKIRARVIVLAATLPEEEVLLIDMGWLFRDNLLETIITRPTS